jgi:homoserine O-succinyltransferase/O-acetyltransferase
MALMMDWGRIPTQWAEKKNGHKTSPTNNDGSDVAKVALINNMPDAALEDTELQFFELLETAAHGIPVHVELYSLPGLPRGDRAREHLDKFYSSTDALLDRKFDGAIITGTEPRQPDLRNEAYWSSLTNLFDWAERNTTSTVLSCLAAHAGVLHSDGIKRHPLSDKQFGVFDYERANNHELLDGINNLVRFPHSRWNEVRADALNAYGYTILTQSPDAGVDMFVKQKQASLFVHFQGHPEYGARTLMKEYRRDIKRFLRGERTTYPSMPHGYFNAEATKLIADFRERASCDLREELMQAFPEAAIADNLQNTWRSSATRIYHNWLQYIVAKKTDRSLFAAMAGVGQRQPLSGPHRQEIGKRT